VEAGGTVYVQPYGWFGFGGSVVLDPDRPGRPGLDGGVWDSPALTVTAPGGVDALADVCVFCPEPS
jgi:hypothetical protein